MRLIDVINDTNFKAEKVKKSKDKINLELVSQSGEQATNLVEVPNKLSILASKYNKIADGNFIAGKVKTKNTVNIPLNLNFIPKFLVFEINSKQSYQSDSKYIPDLSMSNEVGLMEVIYGNYYNLTRCRLNEVTKDFFKITVEFANDYDYEYDLKIKWTAIG